VKRGKTIGLVGTSGAGKSSVINLMQRFYNPDTGSIFVDKINARQWNCKYQRQHMAVVNQEISLFTGTIRENIQYGMLHGHVTENMIHAAAKSANIYNFVQSLPMGFDTMVGDKVGSTNTKSM
jgi:ATP-binding cassette subfamily B (MDR/TAP) protein 1